MTEFNLSEKRSFQAQIKNLKSQLSKKDQKFKEFIQKLKEEMDILGGVCLNDEMIKVINKAIDKLAGKDLTQVRRPVIIDNHSPQTKTEYDGNVDNRLAQHKIGDTNNKDASDDVCEHCRKKVYFKDWHWSNLNNTWICEKFKPKIK